MTYRAAYQGYLQSAAWIEKRRAVLDREDECRNCGGGFGLEVHHIDYSDVYLIGGEILDETPLSKLVPLCRSCHQILNLPQFPAFSVFQDYETLEKSAG